MPNSSANNFQLIARGQSFVHSGRKFDECSWNQYENHETRTMNLYINTEAKLLIQKNLIRTKLPCCSECVSSFMNHTCQRQGQNVITSILPRNINSRNLKKDLNFIFNLYSLDLILTTGWRACPSATLPLDADMMYEIRLLESIIMEIGMTRRHVSVPILNQAFHNLGYLNASLDQRSFVRVDKILT